MEPNPEPETCAICLSGYNDEDPGNTLSCNHTFHGHCIIQWFRQASSRGQCPLCNDNPYSGNDAEQDPYDHYFYYNRHFINERCKLLKRVSRRKDAPTQLVASVQKLKKLEEEHKELKKEEREFKKTDEYKEFRKKQIALDRKIWRKRNSVHSQTDHIVAQYPTIHIYPSTSYS